MPTKASGRKPCAGQYARHSYKGQPRCIRCNALKRVAKADSLRRRADTLFRQIIRERDQWCQGGTTEHQGGPCFGSLQVAHYYRRRHLTVRWDKDNAALLCEKAHQLLDGNPHMLANFFGHRLGQAKLNRLAERKTEGWGGRPEYARVIEELKAEIQGWSLPGYLDVPGVRPSRGKEEPPT